MKKQIKQQVGCLIALASTPAFATAIDPLAPTFAPILLFGAACMLVLGLGRRHRLLGTFCILALLILGSSISVQRFNQFALHLDVAPGYNQSSESPVDEDTVLLGWEEAERQVRSDRDRYRFVAVGNYASGYIKGSSIFPAGITEDSLSYLRAQPQERQLLVVGQNKKDLIAFSEGLPASIPVYVPELADLGLDSEFYSRGKSLWFHSTRSALQSLAPGRKLPELAGTDVYALVGPAAVMEPYPEGTVLLNWAEMLFWADSAISALIAGTQTHAQAIFILPEGVNPRHANPIVERIIRAAPHHEVHIVDWGTIREYHPFYDGHYFAANRYALHDVAGALQYEAGAVVVCFTDACASAAPADKALSIDRSQVLRLSQQRLTLSNYGEEIASWLASYRKVIWVAENRTDYTIARIISRRLQGRPGVISAYSGPIGGLPQLINDDKATLPDHVIAGVASWAVGSIRSALAEIRLSHTYGAAITVVALGLIVGLGLSVGQTTAAIGIVTAGILFWLRHDWLYLPPSLIATPLLSPWVSVATVSVCISIALVWRARYLPASIAATTSPLIVASCHADPFLSLFLIGAAPGFASAQFLRNPRSWTRAQDWPLEELGEKAMLALPMVPWWLRGWIVSPRRFSASLPVFPFRQFIIRSNHLSRLENENAGAFQSKVVDRRSYRDAMKELLKTDMPRLGGAAVQYWVQPYVRCQATGVATSIATGNPHTFTYSLDAPGSVTEGYSQDYRQRPRFGALTSIDTAVLVLLRRCERYMEGPVIVEFGMLGTIAVCFQLRPQPPEPNWERKCIAAIIRPMNPPEIVGEYPVTTYQSSLLSRFNGYATYFINHTQYAVSDCVPSPVLDTVELLQWVGRQVDRAHQLPAPLEFAQYVEALEVDAQKILFLRSVNPGAIRKANLGRITATINKAAAHLGTGKLLVSDRPTPSNIHEAMVALLMALLARAETHAQFVATYGDDRTLAASVANIRPLPVVVKPSNNRWEVVSGRFRGDSVALSDVESCPEKAVKNIVIAEQVPPSKFHLLANAAGVVSFFGSPVSHLALYCASRGLPCRIGTGWRKKYAMESSDNRHTNCN